MSIQPLGYAGHKSMFELEVDPKIETLEFTGVGKQIQQPLLFNSRPNNLYPESEWINTGYWDVLVSKYKTISFGASCRLLNLTGITNNGEPATFQDAMSAGAIGVAVKTIGFTDPLIDHLYSISRLFRDPTPNPDDGTVSYLAGDTVTLQNKNFGLGALPNAVNVQIYPTGTWDFATADFDITIQIVPTVLA